MKIGVKESCSEVVVFGQIPKGSEAARLAAIWGENVPGQGNSNCKRTGHKAAQKKDYIS